MFCAHVIQTITLALMNNANGTQNQTKDMLQASVFGIWEIRVHSFGFYMLVQDKILVGQQAGKGGF